MFALIILEDVLIFDELKIYGLYKICDVNLKGYKILRDYKAIINHYKQTRNSDDVYKVEKYSNFLFRICLNYLKDTSL